MEIMSLLWKEDMFGELDSYSKLDGYKQLIIG